MMYRRLQLSIHRKLFCYNIGDPRAERSEVIFWMYVATEYGFLEPKCNIKFMKELNGRRITPAKIDQRSVVTNSTATIYRYLAGNSRILGIQVTSPDIPTWMYVPFHSSVCSQAFEVREMARCTRDVRAQKLRHVLALPHVHLQCHQNLRWWLHKGVHVELSTDGLYELHFAVSFRNRSTAVCTLTFTMHLPKHRRNGHIVFNPTGECGSYGYEFSCYLFQIKLSVIR